MILNMQYCFIKPFSVNQSHSSFGFLVMRHLLKFSNLKLESKAISTFKGSLLNHKTTFKKLTITCQWPLGCLSRFNFVGCVKVDNGRHYVAVGLTDSNSGVVSDYPALQPGPPDHTLAIAVYFSLLLCLCLQQQPAHTARRPNPSPRLTSPHTTHPITHFSTL